MVTSGRILAEVVADIKQKTYLDMYHTYFEYLDQSGLSETLVKPVKCYSWIETGDIHI